MTKKEATTPIASKNHACLVVTATAVIDPWIWREAAARGARGQ